jgi:DNA segregation ATPase FtsK/SpoIIIE-like protein
MTLLLFCAIVFLILLTGNLVFGAMGGAICTFMYGTFGYASYIIVAALAYLGEWLVFEKQLNFKRLNVAVIALTVFMLFLLFHAVSTRDYVLGGYSSYLTQCYLNAQNGYAGYSFGGVICGLFVYPIAKGTTFIGAYVIYAILCVLCGYLAFAVISGRLKFDKKSDEAGEVQEEESHSGYEEQPVSQPLQNVTYQQPIAQIDNRQNLRDQILIAKDQQIAQNQQMQEVAPGVSSDDDRYSPKNLGKKILFEKGEFDAESYRRNMIFNENSYFNHPVTKDSDYLSSFSSGVKPDGSRQQEEENTQQPKSYTQSYQEEVNNKSQQSATPYIFGDKPTQSLDDDIKQESPVNNVVENNSNTSDEDKSANVVIHEEKIERKSDDLNFNEIFRQTPIQRQPLSSDSQNSASVPLRSSAETAHLPTRDRNTDIDNTIPKDENLSEVIRRTPEEKIEKPQDASSASDFMRLFSSSNTCLPQGGVNPDVSRLGTSRLDGNRLDGSRDNNLLNKEEQAPATPARQSNANLFDDIEKDDDNILTADDDSIKPLGLRGSQQPVPQPEEKPLRQENVQPENEQNTAAPALPSRQVGFAPSDNKTPAFSNEHVYINPPKQPQPVIEEAPKPKHVWKKYVRPTLDLLDDYPENNNVNTNEIEESKQIIVETLANFRIASQIANVVVGPAITRYDVIIEDKTNIKNALKYREAVAMALMKENVTAYLNYTKGAISFEVPNSSRTVVGLKGMLASSQFINCKNNTLTFALGKNVEGEVVCPDITKMPHLLVAGTTGSGKSICLSALIVSLLYKYGPEELRFILVDPKQVEFISYDKLPHLMINEIIYDVDKAIKALNWAIKEMERRYQLFKEMTEKGVATKNLTEYNAHLPEGEEKLPKIVIILDEFGDLMLQAKKDIESRIIRLVQKARACGIHLILATQRPSVDCITGLIKSNLPTRIGFKVNSFDDARTIFDIGGAEKLLGKGDLYYRSPDCHDLERIQGCFIDTHEVQKVTDFIKQNNETYFDQSVSDFINTVDDNQSEGSEQESSVDADTKIDDTFIKALKFCVMSNQASVSMIQRRFPVGYIKAAKIIDWMENMNYITQNEGSKSRKVLLSKDEFIKTYGDIDD